MGVRRALLQETLEAEEVLRVAERRYPRHLETQPKLQEAQELVVAKIEKLWCFDYCNYMIQVHDERDRAGSHLAWLANSAKKRSAIVEPAADDSRRLYRQDDINKEFHNYHTQLYSRVVVFSAGSLAELLPSLRLQTLAQVDAEALGVGITPQEVRAAIKDTYRNKTPETDGLTICRILVDTDP
ncbi:hypothetical protein NDU88_008732 [Pleurodeles waltl]|uniref:Uncharacterized protein n=1 Tax=Pleurodeles waltl TaxID=8319 RepID=A0AAV7RWB8_PLEWA|nr:hypothetical protein NDU88_008732 [Pleurodeles waltl]